ncbi:metal ABC transporter substrate-binding protein [Actinomyces culturomici]|uniref:metal ABC transporter substrate-binding protein n=1 Tax=Actinomyces culturomici TaxID=1926276 RepID=UPI001F3DAEA5|nr:metal ABC transporter substrate-binding protein [Actinomyces culturomici]
MHSVRTFLAGTRCRSDRSARRSTHSAAARSGSRASRETPVPFPLAHARAASSSIRARGIGAGLLAFSSAALLAGCAGATSGTGMSGAADAPVLSVVATTTQICDYTTSIIASAPAGSGLVLDKTGADGRKETIAPTGDPKRRIALTCLLAPNASAHEHEMTPQQAKALAHADVLLVNGVDLEHFLDSAVEASGFSGVMGVTSGVLTAREIDAPAKTQASEKNLPYRVSRGEGRVDVAKWPFPPSEGESAPEFTYDPHVWTSPKNAAIQVANIGKFLGAADEEDAEALKAGADAYATTLDELDGWAAASIDSVPKENRVLFSSHDAFGYLSARYGLEFIGSALSDFNEQQDATAEHIRSAAEQVRASGAKAIFAENSNNSKSIEAIARAAGVTAVIGDDALYGDSLGPAGSAGETYVGSIAHNVETIVGAWGGTLAPVPADVEAAK